MLHSAAFIDDAGEDDLAANKSTDLRHDPWLTPKGTRLAELAAVIFIETEGLRPATMRAPKADALERRRTVSANLVSNLVIAALTTTGGSVAIETGNIALTRYDRRDFPRQVVTAGIVSLERLGLLTRQIGVHRRALSTITPTPAFIRRIKRAKVSVADIGKEQGGETIILKSKASKRGEGDQLIDYAETRQTRRLRAEMERINDYLNEADITIDDQPQPAIHLVREYLLPSSTMTPAFNRHGRIYRGFWIGMERDQRYRIRIGGESCADCDFSGMALQLAYARVGAPMPEGDPYGGIVGLEHDPTLHPSINEARREAIKKAINSLLSRSSPMQALPKGLGSGLGPGWTAQRFVAAVSQRHKPIAHLFCQGIAQTLNHTESCILVHLLLNLMDRGIPALPIHDGIMVPASKEDIALQAMRDASRAVLGIQLAAKSKPLPIPQASPPHL